MGQRDPALVVLHLLLQGTVAVLGQRQLGDLVVELGLALRVCDAGTVLDETVALAARIAAHPRAATRASSSLVRAARRDAVVEANRREQAAFGALLGSAVGMGTLAEFAARPGTGA